MFYVRMKETYFILLSDKLNIPLYLAFTGYWSLNMFYDNFLAWLTIRNVTGLNRNDFFLIDNCSYQEYLNGRVKFDFTDKLS